MDRGELCCDKRRIELRITRRNIAHTNIKEWRAETDVPVGPKGTLDDYVPFYFAPRSPMLLSIHGGHVDGYAGGQRRIMHIVSTCEAVAEHGLPFVFTDGHAPMAPLSRFYDDLCELDRVDWSVMPLTYWNDTQAQPDRKRKRQAEFLVYRSFPWTLVTEIGVINATAKEVVDGIVAAGDHRPKVVVRPGWYYN
ncbi:MAG: DUF4433 domain-containing protein [Dehalococcoidia bacterium]